MKILEIIDQREKEDLKKLTKRLFREENEKKDISISKAMQHDAHKRINGVIKQTRWG